MRQSFLIFALLIVVFAGCFYIKVKMPINRPTEIANNNTQKWWEQNATLPQAKDEWILDAEIPANYVPVPGKEEVYMVIDENTGNILMYRQRTKMDDGTWMWETINPDIPDYYVPVENLENVYRYTDEYGMIHYVRYLRNEDNSFAFVEVDEYGNDIIETDAEEVSSANYVKITDDGIYAAYDNNGVLIGFRKRVQDENGNYYWEVAEEPNAPEPTPTPDPKNVGKGEGSWISGTDENGNAKVAWLTQEQIDEAMAQGHDGWIQGTDVSGAPVNIYVPTEDLGRQISISPAVLPNYATPTPVVLEQTPIPPQPSLIPPERPTETPVVRPTNVPTPVPTEGATESNSEVTNAPTKPPVILPPEESETSTEEKREGYTRTEESITTETKGGWTFTYRTLITYTYDADGLLLSTKKEGPTLISQEKSIIGEDAPNPDLIAPTLDAELTRVTENQSFNTKLANEVLGKLNADRISNGVQALTMSEDSTAMKIAKIRATDMALYGYTDYDSPMYGSLTDMLDRFGISYEDGSLNVWRTTSADAGSIHSRFQVIESSRQARMNGEFSSVGIAVVEKNGYCYVVEVLIH